MAIALSILAAGALASPDDTALREGSGWAGFGAGTWCKLKNSIWIAGRAPAVSVTVSTLAKVGKTTLEVETKTVDMVGLEETGKLQLPVSGEAGKDEREEKREELSDEVVLAAGESATCARARITLTGPQGRRVVTRWVDRGRRRLAKKTVEHFGPDGKPLATETMLLEDAGAVREVAGRKLRCLAYAVRTVTPAGVGQGRTYFCRDVPGGLVRHDLEVTKDGAKVYTVAAELLDFEVK